MKKLVLIGIILLLMNNCEPKEEINPILGKWALSELFYAYRDAWEPALEMTDLKEFLNNGEVYISPEGHSTFKAKYTLDGNQLTINYPFGGPVIYQIVELKDSTMVFENRAGGALVRFKYVKTD
jgi:hypothetical protein